MKLVRITITNNKKLKRQKQKNITLLLLSKREKSENKPKVNQLCISNPVTSLLIPKRKRSVNQLLRQKQIVPHSWIPLVISSKDDDDALSFFFLYPDMSKYTIINMNKSTRDKKEEDPINTR